VQDQNVNAFLVGESFMRTSDPGAKLAELFG
jgi:indole-3-glycerol phosphate synthase